LIPSHADLNTTSYFAADEKKGTYSRRISMATAAEQTKEVWPA
jgi:hypothetical protein